MSHSSVDNYMHIIFATKNRHSLIPRELENRLYAYINSIITERKSTLLRINGVDDHLHLLINVNPSIALSTLVKELKSYSSGWIRKEFRNFNWQEGYGGFSASKSHVEPICRYIERQKEHHQTHSFKNEVALLNEQWGTTWSPKMD